MATPTQRARKRFIDAVVATRIRFANFRHWSAEVKDGRAAYLKHPTAATKRAYRRAKRLAALRLRTFRRSREDREQAKVAYQAVKNLSSREKAIKYARTLLGERENPPGSNRGRRITGWQRSFGEWLVGQPWCGVFIGVILRHVGVEITYRVASVNNIAEDARAGRNGWRTWRSNPQAGEAGDCATVFGYAHVVFIVEHDHKRGGYVTYEGNTSAGASGSQSNGGGSYKRFRPYSAVDGIAVPRYTN